MKKIVKLVAGNIPVLCCTPKGFTLIELLVVVLIIGILAAVALPQYNKAVKKSQGTEALNAIYALDQALTAYYLEHGTYEGANADTLSVKIPDLKHFEYMRPGGSTDPVFQVGCSSSETHYETHLMKPIKSGSDMDIYARWENGQFSCGCSDGSANCEDYFKCQRLSTIWLQGWNNACLIK